MLHVNGLVLITSNLVVIMAKNEWIFDPNYNAWYYLKEDGSYVTGGFNIKNKEYFFQDNGKWIQSPKYLRLNQSQPIFIANQEIF